MPPKNNSLKKRTLSVALVDAMRVQGQEAVGSTGYSRHKLCS